jgi:unspecific monooxygenase
MLVPPRPTPPAAPLPFFRFLRTLRTNALAMWPQAAYEQDVVRRSLLGATNLLVSSPAVVRHVLVDNPDNYRRTHASIRILRPITGDGLLLSTGDAWRLQRRTIAPALAPRMMPLLARHIAAATEALSAQLGTQTDQPVNLLSVVQTLALDIAGRSMFSLQTRQHGAAMREMLTEYGLEYARPTLFDMLLPASVTTLRDLRRRRFQRRWMALIEAIMRERMQAPASDTPRDLFDLLRAARDPETGAGFTDAELRDQVATMILAGHETTAVTLFWALLMLAESPAAQERVAAEATPIDLSPDRAAAALDQLVFTKAVVSETLRLYPPAFLIVRQAIAEDRVGDFEIPRGAVIMMAPWVLHRHRKLWRDPDTFDPTRFLPDAPPPVRFAYLPFGAGPRVCVGAQFALAEANLVLASLVRSFHIRRESTEPVLPVAVVTTQPDHPPLFRLAPRPR